VLGNRANISAYNTATTITTIDTLNVDNLTMSNTDLKDQTQMIILEISSGVTVNNFNVSKFKSKNNTKSVVPISLNDCTVTNLNISDLDIDNAKLGGLYIYLAKLVKNILYKNVVLDTNSVNQIYYWNDGSLPFIDTLTINNCGKINVITAPRINKITIDGRSTLASAPTDSGFYRVGDIVYKNSLSGINDAGWICTTSGSPYNVGWVASTAYNVGDVVRSGVSLYKCIIAGTSGSTSPSGANDFVDGTVTWRYLYDGVATFSAFGLVDRTSAPSTYTPTIQGLTTSGTATYTDQSGSYMQVGRIVMFEASAAWSGHTGTGQLCLTLPGLVHTGSILYAPVTVVYSTIGLAAGTQLVAMIEKNGGKVRFYTLNAGTLTALTIPAAGTVYVTGTYLSA
jgi:hypothetical protein